MTCGNGTLLGEISKKVDIHAFDRGGQKDADYLSGEVYLCLSAPHEGCPKVFIIISFGLSHRLGSPHIAIVVEPYPNRWTHHVIVQSAGKIDGELMVWLTVAHKFALVS